MKILTTANLGSNFTGFYKKERTSGGFLLSISAGYCQVHPLEEALRRCS